VWTLAGVAADLTFVIVKAGGTWAHAGGGVVPILGGSIVIAAGLYQLSPLKLTCLGRCGSPIHVVPPQGRLSALRMGALHGANCLGCCWGIMAVLFVVGLMNLAWMAALSILIVAERLVPRGATLGRLAGMVFVVLGLCMAAQPRLFPASGLQSSDAVPMTGMTPAMPSMVQSRHTVMPSSHAVMPAAEPLKTGAGPSDRTHSK
jgi:hypothetical protein